MVANVKDKAVIVGAYNTSFSKDSGVSELSLAAQAVRGALLASALAGELRRLWTTRSGSGAPWA